MESKLTGSKSVFQDVIETSTCDGDKTIDEWSEGLVSMLQDLFGGIEDSFHLRFGDPGEVEDPRRQEFRTMLLPKVLQARKEVEGPLAEKLKELRRYQRDSG